MKLQKIRHHLHQHPEVSGEEQETAQFIKEKLKALGLKKIYDNFFSHALLAEIDSGKAGKTILFRCELDALPIQETNDNLDYKSVRDGISHKCGHDGHMTMLLGLAEKLTQTPPQQGKIYFLFQPSEENGQGAKGVLASKILADKDIDFVFALHNVPGFPMGSIVCKPGTFTPSVESLEICLDGKTSHAGMPEKGVNPASAIAKLIGYYQSLHQPDPDQEDYFLSTPILIDMGKSAYGTAAGHGKMGYTFRAYDHDFFTQRKAEIEKQSRTLITETQGLASCLTWKEGFEANANNEEAYKLIKKAAAHNSFKFIEKEKPFPWGEDFGALTQQFPGAMFGLGSGEKQPELHNPDFDFPDELLNKGITMFYTLAKMINL